MSDKYFYSADENTWHPESMFADYDSAGTWPRDAKEYPFVLFEQTVLRRPLGKVMRPDENGAPALFDAPQPIITTQVLKSSITSARWQVETGGITLPAGVHVATGLDDQNRITSVIANARLAALDTVSFKASSGWVTLTIAGLEGIAAAIARHVQQCFSAERTHHEAIDALAALHAEDPQALQQALEAYDIEQGWPATDLTDQVPHD